MIKDDKYNTIARRAKGIYLLPNLFTTASLFSGFYAIVAATQDHFESAAIAIFVAMIMDGLDGRVARMTNTQSAFGEQYDSMVDMVSFGVAPAIVMYEWALLSMSEFGWHWSKISWLAAFVFIAGAALRLARFNVQSSQIDKAYFMGLPSPAAAAVIAGFIWLCCDSGISGGFMAYPACALTVICGLLMVSNFTYSSFKSINIRRKVSFASLLIVALLFAFISSDPPKVIFTVAFLYLLSGPFIYTVRKLKKYQKRSSLHKVADNKHN